MRLTLKPVSIFSDVKKVAAAEAEAAVYEEEDQNPNTLFIPEEIVISYDNECREKS